MRFKELKGMN